MAGSFVNVDGFLSIEPEVWRGIERGSKLDGKLRCDLRFFVYDPIDHLEIAADASCFCVNPRGVKNSSLRISPGAVGFRLIAII